MVGYLSYFFDIQDFTDKIMVTLTTLLVIATLSSSIKSVSILVLLHKKMFAEILNFFSDFAHDLLLQTDRLLANSHHQFSRFVYDFSHLYCLFGLKIWKTTRKQNVSKWGQEWWNWLVENCTQAKFLWENFVSFDFRSCYVRFLVLCLEWIFKIDTVCFKIQLILVISAI